MFVAIHKQSTSKHHTYRCKASKFFYKFREFSDFWINCTGLLFDINQPKSGVVVPTMTFGCFSSLNSPLVHLSSSKGRQFFLSQASITQMNKHVSQILAELEDEFSIYWLSTSVFQLAALIKLHGNDHALRLEEKLFRNMLLDIANDHL